MGLIDRYGELEQRQKIIFWVVAVSLIVTIIFALVGIFAKPAQSGPPQVDSTPVTLRWRKLFYNQNDLGDVIAGFKQQYPNVDIQLETVNPSDYGTYYSQLVKDFSLNNPPDIFSINNSDLSALSQYMSPIEYFKGDKLATYTQTFSNQAVRETMQLNKVYGITMYVDNIQMYYNTDILAQNGIALPARSWDEMVVHAKQINKRNTVGDFLQSAISMGTANNVTRVKEILPILIMQQGGVIYDWQNQAVGLGQPRNADFSGSNLARQKAGSFVYDVNNKDNPTMDAVKFYTEFANPLSSFYSWNRQADNSEDAFINGKTAYILHYSYFNNTVKARNPNLRFAVAPLPQSNDANKKTFGNYFMDGMGRQLTQSPTAAKDPNITRKRAAAEAFLVYLSSKEAQKTFNAKTSTPPARKDIVADLSKQSDNPFTRIFAEGSLYADNYYRPRAATNQIWVKMLEDMQTKSIPMNEAISDAVNEYQRQIGLGPDIGDVSN
jgi:ABC-type glycerol-3-phosphate transport system substrate-binding protein